MAQVATTGLFAAGFPGAISSISHVRSVPPRTGRTRGSMSQARRKSTWRCQKLSSVCSSSKLVTPVPVPPEPNILNASETMKSRNTALNESQRSRVRTSGQERLPRLELTHPDIGRLRHLERRHADDIRVR